jgi:adenylate cyclase
VTVLFADVVHSMDIAAAVGAERLREIMAELLDRSAAVVKRYGGTVDKFTGDGIMAVFGAPIALEDHAFRACLTAVEIHAQTAGLAADVKSSDGVDLRLRIGLNSGQVIAGEIGSATVSYTAVGEQVGMAQRMESAAPPGAVMLTESTARLVENTVVLAEPELVRIKGAGTPVTTRRLLAIGEHHASRRSESSLVGRTWELNTLNGILEEVRGGAGCVVTITGPPGIGKSRLVREAAASAAGRGLPVFTTYCEAHTSDVPFHVVAGLLRTGLEIDGLDAPVARARVRDRFPDADSEDLLLFDDLLGIGDPAAVLPDIASDARQRRLKVLVNHTSLARTDPAVYVIEDAHWIDGASESMLADFLAVIPQTPSLVLITYRPEYRGALSRVPGVQSIALRPLNDAHTAALTEELIGADPSLGQLPEQIAARAAGNPFFVEEMVRDLAERGVLHGQRGAYELHVYGADVEVPASLQTTIAARIDRLDPAAKTTLNAAAVIGSRFDADLLGVLVDNPQVAPLAEAELIDQVRFTPRAEYAFRHPLIRTVAYESQLKSSRGQLHRRLAAAIEQTDENAALIAEHLEASGDLHAAFDWHMRAGTWSTNRDIAAAHSSWRRARDVADQLPEDDRERSAMRIAPRTLLSGSAWRVGGSGADTGFDELRDLCTAAGDQRSLAIGMAGVLIVQNMSGYRRQASRTATELAELLDSIGDPTLTVALLGLACIGKYETGEIGEALALAQRVIDLAHGDVTKGDLIIGNPLGSAIAMRGIARFCLGVAGWKDDFHRSIAMIRGSDAFSVAGAAWLAYVPTILCGVLLADETALHDTAESLSVAEQSGDNLALNLARTSRGLVLVRRGGAYRQAGFELLEKMRETALNQQFAVTNVPIADMCVAQERIRLGDLDGAIALARDVIDELFLSDGHIYSAPATAVLVEALLQRAGDMDLVAAQAAIDRLAAVPTEPEFVLHEVFLLRLRALVAQAHGDAATYRSYRDRYKGMARSLGFEGHIAMAEAMA